jgi:hypothetical protein
MFNTKAFKILVSALLAAPTLVGQSPSVALLLIRVPEPSFVPDLAMSLRVSELATCYGGGG